MTDFLLDIWNQVMGSGIVEPTIWVTVGFIVFFIVIPILLLAGAIRVSLWLLTPIREWIKK